MFLSLGGDIQIYGLDLITILSFFYLFPQAYSQMQSKYSHKYPLFYVLPNI